MTRYKKFKIFMVIILLASVFFVIVMLDEMRDRQIETTAKIDFINSYCLE